MTQWNVHNNQTFPNLSNFGIKYPIRSWYAVQQKTKPIQHFYYNTNKILSLYVWDR